MENFLETEHLHGYLSINTNPVGPRSRRSVSAPARDRRSLPVLKSNSMMRLLYKKAARSTQDHQRYLDWTGAGAVAGIVPYSKIWPEILPLVNRSGPNPQDLNILEKETSREWCWWLLRDCWESPRCRWSDLWKLNFVHPCWTPAILDPSNMEYI